MNLPDFLIDSPDGEIRLTGHRISLYHVVDRYQEGYSAEMLAEHYPTLSLALIHKVIAFYLENQAEVDAFVAALSGGVGAAGGGVYTQSRSASYPKDDRSEAPSRSRLSNRP